MSSVVSWAVTSCFYCATTLLFKLVQHLTRHVYVLTVADFQGIVCEAFHLTAREGVFGIRLVVGDVHGITLSMRGRQTTGLQ